jgi:hypothetical protein
MLKHIYYSNLLYPKHYSIFYDRMKVCIEGGSGKNRTENKWNVWGM